MRGTCCRCCGEALWEVKCGPVSLDKLCKIGSTDEQNTVRPNNTKEASLASFTGTLSQRFMSPLSMSASLPICVFGFMLDGLR